jgi:hypothetical protein
MIKKFKEHVKYKIQPQKDGSYVILQKNTGNKKVDIHSTHDTYDDAQDELESIYSKPTQAETMKFLNDLKISMDSIK